MDKIETFHFMQKIKAYYQNFCIEDYIVNEWADRLKPYDINDVYMKLEQHLSGEYRNEIPKLHFITKYLKTPKEKMTDDNFMIRCSICQLPIKPDDYKFHIGRHNSIYYIKKNEQKLGKTFDEEELFNLKQEQFDEIYDSFIEELVDVIKDKEEHQRLKNIIFTKYGMSIEPNQNFQSQLNLKM